MTIKKTKISLHTTPYILAKPVTRPTSTSVKCVGMKLHRQTVKLI